MIKQLIKPILMTSLLIGITEPVFGEEITHNSLFFDDVTDTIEILGQTVFSNESTYEARVYLPENSTAGILFNEWTFGVEDKLLSLSPTQLIGFNYPNQPVLSASVNINFNQWHHVAFVQGSETQSLYLNGQLITSQAASLTISNGSLGGFLGAIFRDGSINNSFIGYLDTFRISNIARYSGNSFQPTSGDLTSDNDTLVLYNFNSDEFFQENGFTLVQDLSSNNLNGRLGTGFIGATSPTIVTPTASVPESSHTLGLILLLGLGLSQLSHQKNG